VGHSTEAKQKTHGDYEIARTTPPESKEHKEAVARQEEVFLSVETPHGADQIESFNRLKE